MRIEQLYDHFLQFSSVETDTRKLKPGDIFFALKGPSFNGNLFAKKALDEGAAFVVVDEDPGFSDNRIIRTANVLTTLQELAGYHRRQFNIPVIAITGSNGKTTTKELVHAVLSSAYRTYTTQGNLNNHIGIPLTLLAIQKDAEIAVVEMGANHLKEIEGYCVYTAPTHGLITNCGKAHLEGFGGIEGVRKGKGELFDYLRLNNGTAFVMWDYDYLREMSKGIPTIYTYGTDAANITGNTIKSEPFLEIGWIKAGNIMPVQTQLVGDYNLPNVLAAIAAGKYFKVPDEKIIASIQQYTPSNSRSQLIEKGSNKIILDAYNANPSSMKLAIENFSKIRADNKVLVLGAMMELGPESKKEHQDIVSLIKNYTWSNVILVGGDFEGIAEPFVYFKNATEATAWLKQHKPVNSSLLVKGSRSMKMETILDVL
ncbi:UDP-N-acetylmuramoylalanyl-D-glutamate--2,6-diaminopimelate ligase [Terrimonas sp.]|uniref:UDP-N-acetylmuramoyl-tripeptide--D-alanyl-D- alanine ligase n=1 Tax=Terrimonas sp. TaxID=1914338 RepID=UPI000D523574|nr:UDP-N-acetylmuramoyl-tripeptide--D-alanyl-D-alanine ligase [Terrimonas sp.]PVD49981.1 UDP-N-acetylmuramoylalanyl-D-glutamate--2,6-diaminopimelate ligase [Terrimonas sp.]PVD52525.1 UDP-N-acetylmuramoylalanyl-D-glutamate--2,6-diaminopimelate ligase [Terrimonas sp.]